MGHYFPSVKEPMTEIAGATVGGAAPGGAQFALQIGRSLTHESIPEVDRVLEGAYHGAYGPMIAHFSLVGQWAAGNGNRVLDDAGSGKLGLFPLAGDRLGDLLFDNRAVMQYLWSH